MHEAKTNCYIAVKILKDINEFWSCALYNCFKHSYPSKWTFLAYALFWHTVTFSKRFGKMVLSSGPSFTPTHCLTLWLHQTWFLISPPAPTPTPLILKSICIRFAISIHYPTQTPSIPPPTPYTPSQGTMTLYPSISAFTAAFPTSTPSFIILFKYPYFLINTWDCVHTPNPLQSVPQCWNSAWATSILSYPFLLLKKTHYLASISLCSIRIQFSLPYRSTGLHMSQSQI